MRMVVIGGSGHVGTFLVPRLVAAGHDVLVVTRAQRSPYQPHAAWRSVQQIMLDRAAEEAAGHFGQQIRDLHPDVVVDMICFTLSSARQLVEALHGQVQHFLQWGTIWVRGPSAEVTTTEAQPSAPWAAYGTERAGIQA